MDTLEGQGAQWFCAERTKTCRRFLLHLPYRKEDELPTILLATLCASLSKPVKDFRMTTQVDIQTLLRVAEWTMHNKRHVGRTIRELAGTEENYLLLARELERVKAQVARAHSLRVEATLTLIDWLTLIDSYQWKCAYCQERPFEVMHHRLPIREGGTTPSNCVPACRGCCTRRKNTLHTVASGTEIF